MQHEGRGKKNTGNEEGGRTKKRGGAREGGEQGEKEKGEKAGGFEGKCLALEQTQETYSHLVLSFHIYDKTKAQRKANAKSIPSNSNGWNKSPYFLNIKKQDSGRS